jgi:signal transduction histidine kinase
MGWFMLVTPHQFQFITNKIAWLLVPLGLFMLFSGMALISLPAFNLHVRWYLPVHFCAFTALVGFGVALTIANAWINPINYYFLAASVLLSSLVIFQSPRPGDRPIDLLVVAIGVSQLISGLFILLVMPQIDTAIFSVDRTASLILALMFIVGGLALTFVHIFPIRSTALYWAVHLFNSATLVIFFIRTTVPEYVWVGSAYYVTFALIIGLYPFLSRIIDHYRPYKLANRLSIGLIFLILLVMTMTELLTNLLAQEIEVHWSRGNEHVGQNLVLALLLIFVVLAVFATIRFTSSLTSPLRDLARASEALAEGSEQVPLARSQIEELDLLSITFSDMRSRLAARNQELHLSRRMLEQRVLDRTQEVTQRASELEALMDAVPAAVIISHDAESNHVTANLAAYHLLRLPPGFDLTQLPEQYRARKILLKKDGAELPLEKFPLMASARTGVSYDDYEMEIVFANREKVSVIGTIIPLFDPGGRPDGAISAFTDITRLKSLEAALQQSNRDLQDFAFIASHDLQEPLRKIQAFGAILTTKLTARLYPDEADALERVTGAARRMSTMIHDLLAYSRVSTRGQPFRQVELNRVIEEVINDLEVQIVRQGAVIEVDPLPVLQSDEMQMHQLFLNLLSNAIKYHRPDIPPKIRVHCTLVPVENSGGPTARIEVEDNGIGFDIQYLDRIFQPFQRLHGRSQYEGTGIGLAICKKIVDRHRGTITAASKLQEGSTFIIELPVDQPLHEDCPDAGQEGLVEFDRLS